MMMKRIFMGAMALLLPSLLLAQVAKQVEVTKSYEPTIERALKLPIQPDMTDTTQLRPEIDYTITPLSLETSLKTRPLRPAQLTYWEFNRPKPYYLKAGLGVPLQSVADLHVATQQPSIGYALAYLNHEGRYGDIENDFAVKKRATRLDNRLGGAVGRYLGKRVIELDADLTHHLGRRYGMSMPESMATVGEDVGYADLAAKVRYGDDFQHLERTNYELWLQGGLFYDRSDELQQRENGRESRWALGGKVAHSFGGNDVAIEMALHTQSGGASLDGFRQRQFKVGGRYGHGNDKYNLEAGLDFCYDHHKQQQGVVAENYLFPFLRLEVDLISDVVKPFLEVDGGLQGNDLRSLMVDNPYLATASWMPRSTATWEGRAGITGHSKNNLFAYRAYVGMSLSENQRYWLLPAVDREAPKGMSAGYMLPYLGRQTRLMLGGELTYRPALAWTLEAGLRFESHEDEDTTIESGLPAMQGHASIRYASQKIRFGVKFEVMSERSWSYVDEQTLVAPTDDQRLFVGSYEAPFACDLTIDFEWMISGSVALFAQGGNLLGSDLYRLPTMPEYGANALLGVRIAF